MNIFRVVTLVAFGFMGLFAFGQPEAGARPTYASILQLIATPDRFDGRTIETIGFLTLGHEDDYLYPYENDAIHEIDLNAIGIVRTKEMETRAASLDHKYVRIVGKFRKSRAGDLDAGVVEIQTCQTWSDPKRPRSEVMRRLPGANSR